MRSANLFKALARARAGAWSVVVAGCVGVPLQVAAQRRVPDDGGPASWDRLEGCHLRADRTSDGDSFHVEHEGREYAFRLYFVDAPEVESTYPDRLGDQAAYFGITTNQVLEFGRAAQRFTSQRLQGRVIVITRWQNAYGRGTLARHYAVVLVEGRNLAEELVRSGLARIHGPRANWPDGPRSTQFVALLKNLELQAREKRLGVWHEAAGPAAGPATGRNTAAQDESAGLETNSA